MEKSEGGLTILSMTLGPAQTNAYLLADPATSTAAAIDPAWDGDRIASEAEQRGWRVVAIWLTHAHFDHFGGAGGLSDRAPAPLPVALHPADYPLWKALGGAPWFGYSGFDPGPEPTVELQDGLRLHLGDHVVEVRHAPGHTPGHVIFYLPPAGIAFCGDVIFEAGVGRADLPGGDWETLLASIRSKVLSLPDATTLYPGHGRPTTVGRERATNPFLTEDFE